MQSYNSEMWNDNNMEGRSKVEISLQPTTLVNKNLDYFIIQKSNSQKGHSIICDLVIHPVTNNEDPDCI